MSIASVLAALACSVIVASGAELRGTWSATKSAGPSQTGTWTAEAHLASGGVTGYWTLRDTAGKILLSGSWSASKLPQAWEGAWRATVTGGGEYAGAWTAQSQLPSESRLFDMFDSALRAVVSGTWQAGAHSGAWSIRAWP